VNLMRRILISIFLLLPLSLHAGNRIAELSKAPARSFTPSAIKPVTLSNGMKCYLLEDKVIPTIQGLLIVKGGGVYADIKRSALASVMMQLIKEGGTIDKSPEKVREFLDEHAIDITFSATQESFEGAFAGLSKETDNILGIFFEMLFDPAFDNDILTVVKKRVVDGLKREMEVSGPIAHRNFRELVYGAESPWGVIPKPSGVKKVSKNDVGSFYNEFFSPDRMILAVAGDFNKAELIKKLEAFANKYPKRELPALSMPKVTATDSPKEKFISKKFTQSAIDIGHLGSTRDNTDKYALVLMNDILGGSSSFSNRLMDAVRVKGGLAYEVWSAYTFGPDGAPGIFQMHAKTRNQTTEKAIETIISELQKLHENGAIKEELKRVKTGILNNLVFEYETPFNIASSTARFAYFGYPENYIEIYKKAIERTTLDDVNKVAKKYLHPDKLKVVIVGQKK